MRLGVLGIGLALWAALGTTVCHSATEITPVKKQSCARSILRHVSNGLVLFALLAGTPPLVVDSVGQMQQTPHVGLGIFFDWPGVKQQLSTELVAEIESDTPDQGLIKRKLAEEMTDGFLVGEEHGIFRPRLASDYMKKENKETLPQVCRHKALIAGAILNRAGIRSKVCWGKITPDRTERDSKGNVYRGSHVWLYLPDTDEVLDPTNGIVMPAKAYNAEFEVSEHFIGFTPVAKTVGLAGR